MRPPSSFWSRKIVAMKASTVSSADPVEVSDDFVFSPSISSMLFINTVREEILRPEAELSRAKALMNCHGSVVSCQGSVGAKLRDLREV
jgi:hypothetical protein